MEGLARALGTCDLVSPWLFVVAAAATLVLIFLPGRRQRRGLALDLGYWGARVEFKSRRLLVMALASIAISLLIALAIAEPRMIVKPSISIYGKPVVAVVDVSGSMGSKPKAFAGGVANSDTRNGYEKARDVFMDLIGRRPDVNFALLLYSTDSYIARYFAYKNELLSDTVENKAEIEYMSTGTRTAEALVKARLFLTNQVTGPDKAIVLISDLNGDLTGMVSIAEELETEAYAGIRTYVIVITSDGTKPTLPAGLADFRMVEMNDRAGIDQIVQEISEMRSSPLRQEQVTDRASLIPYVVLPGLGLILVALILTETRWRKIP